MVATLSSLIILSSICGAGSATSIPLPPQPADVSTTLAASLEELLCSRESVRLFSDGGLSLDDVSAVLWASCGAIPDGRMTIPSAGALYPLEIILVAGDVEGLGTGLYRYLPPGGSLEPILSGDIRAGLAEACLGQPWVAVAPASIVICARPEITTSRYGSRGERYVLLEAGHSSQNAYLMCTALGLGTVAVGAFDDSMVSSILMLGDEVIPLYVMPFGVPSESAD